MNFVEYRKRVEILASERTGETIANGSFDHAAIIIQQMFKSAEHQVSILTGNLNARVYGRAEVVEEAKLFLAQGDHSARFLLESEDSLLFRDHPLFERLRHNENLEARIVPEEMRNQYKYHFLVMDDDSYRFEPTKDGPTAVAAFGDKDTVRNLAEIFAIIWDVSKKVELPSRNEPAPA